MQTVFIAGEVAAEEAAIAVSLKDCAARLTGYAVVVALPSEMLTIAHRRS
jgi:hypothetical protein